MNKTKKIIGQRIREVLEAQEKLGTGGSWNTAKLTPEIKATNVDKYLERACGLGFASVDRSQRPKAYTVKPDWRELIAERERLPKLQHSRKPKADAPKFNGVKAQKLEALKAMIHPLQVAWA